jgi:hypothetical protein
VFGLGAVAPLTLVESYLMPMMYVPAELALNVMVTAPVPEFCVMDVVILVQLLVYALLPDVNPNFFVKLAGIWDRIKRVRATVKGAYGDDSSEYELVGGTRMSERRQPARRAQA